MTGFLEAMMRTHGGASASMSMIFLFSDERSWQQEWEQNRLDFLMDRIDVDAYEAAVEQLLRREP